MSFLYSSRQVILTLLI